MATTRLTNSLRDDITKALMKNKYEATMVEFIAEGKALAARLYDVAYPKAVQRKMKVMPKGFFNTDSDIYWNCAGQRHRVPHNGYDYNLMSQIVTQANKPDQIERWRAYTTNDLYVLTTGSEEAEALQAFALKSERLVEETQQTKQKTRAALGSVTTIAKLIKIWPEVKPFIPDWALETGVRKPNYAVPSIRAADLNQMLNLPVEQSHASN